MRNQLALPAPAARHPFRQSLARPSVAFRAAEGDDDLKLFVLSYTAFFICIYTFIF